jgi:hypothetical protein
MTIQTQGQTKKLMATTVRITGRVPLELNDQIEKMSLQLGMGKTAFISLCIRAGINSVIRSINPEKMLSTEDWEKILKVGKDLGLQEK